MTEKDDQTQPAAAIRNAMRRAEAAGKHIGRPRGTTKQNDELLREYAHVVEALKHGLSLRQAAARAGVAVNTVRKIKALLPDSEAGPARKAHPVSSLPLRPVAATIDDWRRYNAKHGDLLVCGHFVPEAEWGTWDSRKARRCPHCASKHDNPPLPYWAVSLLDRPFDVDRRTLVVISHRPVFLRAASSSAALEQVRRALGWRKLPAGTEVWQVENPKTVGDGTLSPRIVKALALLDANRVLGWMPHHDKGGGIYNLKEGRVQGRAALRLTQDECRALHANRYVHQYRMLPLPGAHGEFGDFSVLYVDRMLMGWLIDWNGRNALKAHDQRAGISRRYHEPDLGLFDY